MVEVSMLWLNAFFIFALCSAIGDLTISISQINLGIPGHRSPEAISRDGTVTVLSPRHAWSTGPDRREPQVRCLRPSPIRFPPVRLGSFPPLPTLTPSCTQRHTVPIVRCLHCTQYRRIVNTACDDSTWEERSARELVVGGCLIRVLCVSRTSLVLRSPPGTPHTTSPLLFFSPLSIPLLWWLFVPRSNPFPPFLPASPLLYSCHHRNFLCL